MVTGVVLSSAGCGATGRRGLSLLDVHNIGQCWRTCWFVRCNCNFAMTLMTIAKQVNSHFSHNDISSSGFSVQTVDFMSRIIATAHRKIPEQFSLHVIVISLLY